jgi:hypothetical protein
MVISCMIHVRTQHVPHISNGRCIRHLNFSLLLCKHLLYLILAFRPLSSEEMSKYTYIQQDINIWGLSDDEGNLKLFNKRRSRLSAPRKRVSSISAAALKGALWKALPPKRSSGLRETCTLRYLCDLQRNCEILARALTSNQISSPFWEKQNIELRNFTCEWKVETKPQHLLFQERKMHEKFRAVHDAFQMKVIFMPK